MKKIAFLLIILLLIFTPILYFLNLLRPVSKIDKREIVIIDSENKDAISLQLSEKGFIKSFMAFNIAFSLKGNPKVEPGGYYLSKNMDSLKIIDALSSGPDLRWVTIPEGMRKEQIGEKVAEVLGWNSKQIEQWNNSIENPDYQEGVYFPDKYLIPVDEPPSQVAARMIRNFNEKFAPYFEKFAQQNIKWTTALKIASIIQREAGGTSDMPLIAGVLWNRLLEEQKLDIDATIQYAVGKRDGKWWSSVTGDDIQGTNSAYNTYKYSGLPPTPISNPGLSAIEAVLNPKETDCFYYLHDRSRQIHCAATYEEHLENIEKYL